MKLKHELILYVIIVLTSYSIYATVIAFTFPSLIGLTDEQLTRWLIVGLFMDFVLAFVAGRIIVFISVTLRKYWGYEVSVKK